MRQGCPPSLLLFAIAIETLVLRFWQSALVTGITLGDRIDTIGLYVDDFILYLQNASTSLPAAMQIIETYGTYSGLQINWQKSALMPLYPQECNHTAVDNPLKVVPSFKYVGVIIRLSTKY